jgi:hypothetical protein
LLDHVSVVATFVAGAGMLVLGSIVVGNGQRLQPHARFPAANGVE